MLTLVILTALVLCVGNVSKAVYNPTLFLIFALHYSKGYFVFHEQTRSSQMAWQHENEGTDCTSESRPTPAAGSYMHYKEWGEINLIR